ncbi:MAG TPA: diversity-generating retroelement protein Avd [Anaerolineaceae bacterium]|nr:diversity-generating retroelement protein Avd [Anaerolineaceae bacterium]
MIEKPRTQSPIFVKTYDFLLWLIPLTLKYPKSQRFLLAEKTSQIALDFYNLILEGALKRSNEVGFIVDADLLLTTLRLYSRLGFDLKCISMSQYEFASRSLDEIGRLLGGWKRRSQKQPV